MKLDWPPWGHVITFKRLTWELRLCKNLVLHLKALVLPTWAILNFRYSYATTDS